MRLDNEMSQIQDLVEQLKSIRAQECVLSLLRNADADNLHDDAVEKINNQNNDLWRGVRAQGYEVIDELKVDIINIFGPLEEVWNKQEEVDGISKTPGILTDFAPISQVCLAYPEQVSYFQDDYSSLTPFYDNLLRQIPTETEVLLAVKSRAIAESVGHKKLRIRLRCFVISDLETIWLRDAVGFNLGTRLVKPIAPAPRRMDESVKLFHSLLNLDLDELDLVWDGGNLATDGRYGFISSQLLKKNKKFSQQQIERLISEKLGIELVWVELPKANKLSHTDGYLTFIAPNEVLVSIYPAEWAATYSLDQECADKIAAQARERGLKVHRLLEAPVDTPKTTSTYSAEGIYINFLQLNDKWLVPTYSKPGEAELIEQLEHLNSGGSVIRIDCTELAKFGGVLHYISFCN